MTRLIACIDCDLLLRLRPLAQREQARCPRCGSLLGRGDPARAREAFPFALAALLLLPLSLSFPFLSFSRSGIEHEMSLLQTSLVLAQDGQVLLSGVVLAFIIVIPSLVAAAICYLSLALYVDRPVPGLRLAARFAFTASRWSMVEVFIIGALVSLVKIAELAYVVVGISLWSYLGLAVLLVLALSRLDRLAVWQRIERFAP